MIITDACRTNTHVFYCKFSLSYIESALAKIANELSNERNGHREKSITFIGHTPFIN